MPDRPGSVALGTNVRAVRRTRGLTQDALAARAGITKSYVCRIERGQRPVKPELLERLAEALEVEPRSLDETSTLETRSTAWVIETAQKGRWVRYDPPGETGGVGSARDMIATLRTAYAEYEWRAVRVETIETVEVW